MQDFTPTAKQLEVLAYVAAYITSNCIDPSIKAIAAACKINEFRAVRERSGLVKCGCLHVRTQHQTGALYHDLTDWGRFQAFGERAFL